MKARVRMYGLGHVGEEPPPVESVRVPIARNRNTDPVPRPGEVDYMVLEEGDNTRPRIDINWEVFDALCSVRCTEAEIAAYFRCTPEHIADAVRRDRGGVSFKEYYGSLAAMGSTAIRRKQFQMALAGNVTLLIWLGKQILDQSDAARVKTEVSGPAGAPVEVNVNDVRQRVTGRIASIAARLAESEDISRSN